MAYVKLLSSTFALREYAKKKERPRQACSWWRGDAKREYCDNLILPENEDLSDSASAENWS